MNATELLNQAADLLERDGWRPADAGWDARCVSNAVYQIFTTTELGSVSFIESIDAVKEVIGVDTLEDIWHWNDTVCFDKAEAVNTIRKAAENAEAVRP